MPPVSTEPGSASSSGWNRLAAAAVRLSGSDLAATDQGLSQAGVLICPSVVMTLEYRANLLSAILSGSLFSDCKDGMSDAGMLESANT